MWAELLMLEGSAFLHFSIDVLRKDDSSWVCSNEMIEWMRKMINFTMLLILRIRDLRLRRIIFCCELNLML